MRVTELAVEGVRVFHPDVFPDDRGLLTMVFQEPAFVEAVGKPLFSLAQLNVSHSRHGVVRGVHYTKTPPGCSKYIYCPRGRVLDIIVDVRVGSPTFGQWDTVVLDQEAFRGAYLPVGVGNAFVALEDDSVMCYLQSQSYVPGIECAVSVTDPELGLPIPGDAILSARDQEAPTLAEALAAGALPDYATCTSGT